MSLIRSATKRLDIGTHAVRDCRLRLGRLDDGNVPTLKGSHRMTLLESEEIGTVGVGEATTLHLVEPDCVEISRFGS